MELKVAKITSFFSRMELPILRQGFLTLERLTFFLDLTLWLTDTHGRGYSTTCFGLTHFNLLPSTMCV